MPNDSTAGDLVARHTFRLEGARFLCQCGSRFLGQSDYQEHIRALIVARTAPPSDVRAEQRPMTKRQPLPLAEIEREYQRVLNERSAK